MKQFHSYPNYISSGVAASKVAVASVTVGDDMIMHMSDCDIKDYVYESLRSQLSNHIVKDIEKNMTIEKKTNAHNATTTYTGVIDASNISNTLTISANGISGSSISQVLTSPVQQNLRVVEYTKGGKISRVELQFYDESNDDWIKVPRIQIEE